MNTDSILVTGGAGFIGSHTCDRLLETGRSVVCLDNFNDSYCPRAKRNNIKDALTNPRFKLVEGDILDVSLIGNILSHTGADTVIHLAALAGVRNSIQAPLDYVDTDIKGTAAMLEACKTFGIRKFIFASSSSVYGLSQIPFREEDASGFQCSPYAVAKYSGELFCRMYTHLYGISTVCLRFFTVYGPRQRPDMAIHKFAKAILEGSEICIFGDGSSSRDYTYIDDIVDGIISSISLNCGFEAINLGNSCQVNIMDLVKIMENVLGKPAKIRFAEKQPGDVPSTCASIGKAAKLLGYRPKVSLEEGLRRFAEWFKAAHASS
ncbi:MAG: GDP-mannose 4,6-dehydratase [Acetivibrionales bacterium]|jgi:UDP-glucuronate 4-epimerase